MALKRLILATLILAQPGRVRTPSWSVAAGASAVSAPAASVDFPPMCQSPMCQSPECRAASPHPLFPPHRPFQSGGDRYPAAIYRHAWRDRRRRQQVDGVTQDVGAIAATAGRDLVGRPLNTTALGRDPRGLPVVAGEVLAVSPSTESLAIARRLNFRILRQDQLDALGLSTTVLGCAERHGCDCRARGAAPGGSERHL